MDDNEKNEILETYIERSIKSQKGWARKGGPNRHLNTIQQLELAKIRAQARLYILEHPPPVKPNPDLPF